MRVDPADGEFDSAKEDLTALLDTTGWSPGRHIVYIESQDSAGNWGVPNAVFLTISGEPAAYLPLMFKSPVEE